MSINEAPKNVSEFLNVVDRKDLQRETGLSVQVVTRAKKDGLFPAHWFWMIREFCKSRGLDVPEHLFKGHPEAKGTEEDAA